MKLFIQIQITLVFLNNKYFWPFLPGLMVKTDITNNFIYYVKQSRKPKSSKKSKG